MEFLKNFFTSKGAKTWYWQTGNGFVVLLIGTLSAIKPDEVSGTALLVIAGVLSVLNIITKEINKRYLS